MRAKAGAPIWRRDDETGQTYALKLTAAGAKAIAVDEAMPSESVAERRSGHPIVSVDRKPEPSSDPAAAIDRPNSGVATTPTSPRGGRPSGRWRRERGLKPINSASRSAPSLTSASMFNVDLRAKTSLPFLCRRPRIAAPRTQCGVHCPALAAVVSQRGNFRHALRGSPHGPPHRRLPQISRRDLAG